MNEGNANVIVNASGAHEHYDVFISYRRDGGLDLARSIAYWFRLKGFKCFLDQTELLTGQFNEQIYSAIENTKYFLLLMTEHSLDRCKDDGDWVRQEIEYAIKKRGRDCIIPITPISPPPFPKDIPETMAFLRNCEVSEIDRQKNFDSTLRTVVEHRMPDLYREIKRRNLLSENEQQLLDTIRWYKRNDGKIDDDEHWKINKAAEEYKISPARLEAMINQVEREVAEENDETLRRLIESCVADDGRISDKEMTRINAKAAELQIPEPRLARIMAEIEGKKKNETSEIHRRIQGLEKENGQLRATNDQLEESYDRLKDESNRLKEANEQLETENYQQNEKIKQLEGTNGTIENRRKTLKRWLCCVGGILALTAGMCVFLCLRNDNISDDQLREKLSRITAEAQSKVDAADKARNAVEQKIDAAEKKAASALATLERVEKSAAEAQSKMQKELDEARSAVADLEKEKNDAEKRAIAAETRTGEVEKKSASEQKSLKAKTEADRAQFEKRATDAESAQREAEAKANRLSLELDAAKKKIDDLEKEQRRREFDNL